jgi:hypothetical protein
VKWTGGTKKDAGCCASTSGFAGDDTLEHIDWETWFETFDESDLAFVCQTRSGGQISRFNKPWRGTAASGTQPAVTAIT